MNIAHLHVRLARQAGERDGQPGATVTLTQARPARLIPIFCGSADPIMVAGVTLPMLVLPMGTSSGLNGVPRTKCPRHDFGNYAPLASLSSGICYPPGRIAAILPGG